ncbi:MAG: cellulose biosynthesis cyclic di-GMP-binding regulatory protein BcsB [Rhizobiaceae bacterium]|nr:cellulose biosynthesis cyclic di-GMP-binding regulatory protein BcsB [Rhizobiaceae bacterium]
MMPNRNSMICRALVLACLCSVSATSLCRPAAAQAAESASATTSGPSGYDNILKALERLRPTVLPGSGNTGATAGDRLVGMHLHHLPPHPLGPRLSGESDSRTWPFYAGAAMLGRPAVFRLAYMNAVSIMPEGSFIEVYVNGEQVHRAPIQATVEPAQVDIEIPAQLMALGYNAITVKAVQRHRVDCSPDATYELWTDVVESATGFLKDGTEQLVRSLADLPSVTPSEDGKVRLRALLPDRPSDAQVQNAFDLAQMIALAGDFASPVIEIGEGFGPGIDLFVGSIAELKGRAPDLADLLTGPGPFHIISEPETGAIFVALILEGEITRETMRKTVPVGEVNGTPLGLQTLAMFSPARIFEGRRTTLRALGFQNEEFSGRLYRRSFQINLSPDFYPADYNVVKINLSGAYVSGLSSRSALTVRVNGVTRTSIALGNSRGAVLKNKQIELALSAFKAGRNTVEIEAHLARESDTPECMALTGADAEPRFMLSPESTIIMPPIAHFGMLPDLGNTLRSGFPYVSSSSTEPATIFLTDREEATLSAAASMLAHLASAAGQPVDFRLQTGLPRGDEQNAIIVGALTTLPASVTDLMPALDAKTLRSAWAALEAPDAPAAQSAPALDTLPTNSIAALAQEAADAAVLEGTTDPEAELRRFRERWTTTDDQGGIVSFFHRWQEKLASMLAEAGIKEGDEVLPASLEPGDSRLAVAQNLSPSARGVWTVVTAPDAVTLSAELARFLRPEPISDVNGIAVGFSSKTAEVINAGQPSDRAGILGARSFGNMRLVIAGWLSNNPFVYVGGLIGALIIGGFTANRFLMRNGRQDGHVTGTGEHG